jgi:carbon-monoxide dehydrogenase medium subunit
MLPRSFNYFAAETLEDAIDFLKDHKGEAKVLAGGMSLIPLMKLRLTSPSYIVDINRIRELDQISEGRGPSGDSLFIGALTRHHKLESSDLVRTRASLLAETAAAIGDPQVRNLGTIGGALAHCDPSGDLGASVLALRGEIQAVGPAGVRSITADDFFVDTFASALGEDEVLTQLSVPRERSASGAAYMKFKRRAGDYATVGVAVHLSLAVFVDDDDEDSGTRCESAGIGLTSVGAKSLRASRAEKCLEGNALTEETIAKAASAAAEDCSPTNDPLRGSADYKREMVRLFTRRAIELSIARAMTNRKGKG